MPSVTYKKTRLTAELVRQSELTTLIGVALLLGVAEQSIHRIRRSDPSFPIPVSIPGLARPLYRVRSIIDWLDAKAISA